jgi:hypothetical protein
LLDLTAPLPLIGLADEVTVPNARDWRAPNGSHLSVSTPCYL